MKNYLFFPYYRKISILLPKSPHWARVVGKLRYKSYLVGSALQENSCAGVDLKGRGVLPYEETKEGCPHTPDVVTVTRWGRGGEAFCAILSFSFNCFLGIVDAISD